MDSDEHAEFRAPSLLSSLLLNECLVSQELVMMLLRDSWQVFSMMSSELAWFFVCLFVSLLYNSIPPVWGQFVLP